jgi:hypothetical protein
VECIETHTLNGTQQIIRVDPHRVIIIAPNMEYVQVEVTFPVSVARRAAF